MTLARTLAVLAVAVVLLGGCRKDRQPPPQATASASPLPSTPGVLLNVPRAASDSSAAPDTTQIVGIQPGSAVHATPVTAESLVRLLSGISVLAEQELGASHHFVRVLGAWGPYAGLECDCLATDLYITLNDGGEDIRLYRVDALLDPNIDSLRTEGGNPVVYVTYGLATGRQAVRMEFAQDHAAVTQVTRR